MTSCSNMSAEIDVFRAELLRQKIIFEAELRRQRETFEDKIVLMGHQLQDRETDCRNLQNVVTILGKRVDALQELIASLQDAQLLRSATPRRTSSPARSERSATTPLRRLQSPYRASDGSVILAGTPRATHIAHSDFSGRRVLGQALAGNRNHTAHSLPSSRATSVSQQVLPLPDHHRVDKADQQPLVAATYATASSRTSSPGRASAHSTASSTRPKLSTKTASRTTLPGQ